jgi:hypothetical protein
MLLSIIYKKRHERKEGTFFALVVIAITRTRITTHQTYMAKIDRCGMCIKTTQWAKQ